MTPEQRKEHDHDRRTLEPHALFMKWCPQPLDFKHCCKVAQAGYFDYLAASYASCQAMAPDALMTDDEWCEANGGVPSSVLIKVIKPAAAKLVPHVFVV